MNRPGQSRRGRVSMVCRAGALGIAMAVCSSGLWGQYYPPSGGSRKSVSLRSNLTVGQGPSTIHMDRMRAYSTGLENVIRPTQSAAGGVLGSSMYGGSSNNVPRAVPGGPRAGAASLPPLRGMHSQPVRAPDQPLRIGSGGAVAVCGISVGSLMAPTAEPDPAAAPGRPDNLPKGRVTSLVPKVPWDYTDRMAAGEKAFRKGEYAEALAQFEKARRMSDNCAESLLGLAHASLATAKDSYDETAGYLAATIKKFPYLPLVDVHPRDFFGKEGDYEGCVARLETAVKTNGKDGSALLVLGYLRMRDNLFPAAVRLLNEAAKVTTDKEQALAIDVLLKAMAQVRQDAVADAPKMAPPVELAWAGLKLALPEGFASLTPSDANQFLTAARGGDGTDKPQMINGFAYAVDKDVTARMILDQAASAMSSNLAVSKLTQLEEMELPYLGTTAVARLYSCQYMDEPVILVRLCFDREVAATDGKGKPARLMYVLGMGLLESDVESLLPTFSAVARSVSLLDVRRPLDLLPTANRREVSLTESGFAIQQPQGWTGRRTERGYDMSATDFGLGGGGLQVQAVALLAPGAIDGRTFGQKVIQDRTREGQRIAVLSEKPARFAGLDGHEFLICRTVSIAPAAATATRASGAGETAEVLEMARLACIRAEGGQTRVFAMIVRGQKADGLALRNAMDSLAGGFRLVKP